MRRISLLVALVLALVAAGCSDDGSESDGSSSPTTAATTDETTATTAAGNPATGDPIVIGFINNEGGAFSVPELRVGSEVAETYINEQLGGVNGRPIEVDRCATDGTPESAIDCVNGFIERGVVAVIEGTDLGADAVLPLLTDAGIPMLGHVDRDVDVARAYLAFAEREGWVVEQAHAALLLGTLDDDPGGNLALAYRTFDTMGAAPWRRRAAAALRDRGLTVPRRVTEKSSSLTETEVQLVRLVRDGLSNRQIATAMSYSPKTIEVYLSRLYAKTGFASRLELIRAVDTGAIEL